MTRKLKALGLAFVAVLAFGALSATAASAATSFHSEQAHTIIDGTQPVAEDDVFTVKAGTVKCTSATYSGTTEAATTTTVKVTPAYSGCTAFGFVSTPVDVPAGCTYTFNATNDDLAIACTGSPITVTAFNCHVKVGTQTATSGISYSTAGSGTARDVTVKANITGLKYTQESKSFPGCTNGTFEDGKYVGSGTVTGTNTAGGAVGIWWT
jgi:hypothetical protein